MVKIRYIVKNTLTAILNLMDLIRIALHSIADLYNNFDIYNIEKLKIGVTLVNATATLKGEPSVDLLRYSRGNTTNFNNIMKIKKGIRMAA